ncbi:MAG: 2-carboxy-D-arabinitol-1-phosphatase [Lachnospiraceae bacterium]
MKSNVVRFYLVRHGQTYTNLNKRMVGARGSAPLTPQGRLNAKYLGLGLADVEFDAAYSSKLARAYETAQMILLHRDIPIEKMDGLQDVDWGIMEGGLPQQALRMKEQLPEDPLFPLGTAGTSEYQSMLGGETAYQFVNRLEQALHKMAERHACDGGNLLVVSHAAIGIFLDKYADFDAHSLMDSKNISGLPEVDNTSVSIVEWREGQFTVRQVNELSYLHKGEATAKAQKSLTISLVGDVETLFRKKGLMEGCATSCLTGAGIVQARQMKETLGHIDIIYISILDRAAEFGSILCEGDRDIPVSVRENLGEIRLSYWEGAEREAIRKTSPEKIEALDNGGEALLQYRHPDGGESGIEAAIRIEREILRILEENQFKEHRIVILTHDVVLKAFSARRHLKFMEQSADEPILLTFCSDGETLYQQ